MPFKALKKKIESIRTIDGPTKRLFLQAFFLSGLVKLALLVVPFKRILTWKGAINVESPRCEHEASLKFRRSLKVALRLCDKYTVWKTECYTRAITGQIILRKNNIPATIYVGFKSDGKGNYQAHAWLRAYDTVVTGGEEMDSFEVHTFYS